MRILVRCPIYPTENTNMIIDTIGHFIPNAQIETSEEERCMWIQSKGSENQFLTSIRDMIHEYRVIDAARKTLQTSWTGTTATMRLDKQAASSKKLRIVDQMEEPPLGTIDILLSFDDEEQYNSFLSWFTPPTKDGRIVKS